MMGDIFAFSSEIDLVAGKSKARSSPGGALRKTLADVTNIQPRPKQSIAERNSELVPTFAKDMDRLNKENEALKKEILALKMQLAERNKITELSATELQKLRQNLQSLYQQNLQLAQANSQMLAELNCGKDRLKAMHHEVGCLRGVLNMKTVDENKAVDGQQTCNNVPTIKSDTAGESSFAEKTNIKRSNTNTRRSSKVTDQSAAKDTTEEKSENKRLSLRRKSSRFKSEEPPACTDDPLKLDEVKSAANATNTDKEKPVNKRLCVRRQSSRFKSEEPAPSEDLFESDDITLPMHSQVDEKKGGDPSASLALSDNGQDAAVRNSTGSVSTEERRTSIARPSRRAAEKVQSYKEIPLNVKMRRST